MRERRDRGGGERERKLHQSTCSLVFCAYYNYPRPIVLKTALLIQPNQQKTIVVRCTCFFFNASYKPTEIQQEPQPASITSRLSLYETYLCTEKVRHSTHHTHTALVHDLYKLFFCIYGSAPCSHAPAMVYHYRGPRSDVHANQGSTSYSDIVLLCLPLYNRYAKRLISIIIYIFHFISVHI